MKLAAALGVAISLYLELEPLNRRPFLRYSFEAVEQLLKEMYQLRVPLLLPTTQLAK